MAYDTDTLYSDLDQLTDDFPEDFFKEKVLPELLKSVEFGGGGAKAFSVVMKIATKLTDDDFDTKITPVVIRLFQNPDRAIRVCLLDNLHLMIDRLSQKVVNDKIFPNLVSGFTDLAPVVREQTLKSVLVIVGKLSDRTLNGELLKCLAKTANDEQPGIRTNTTICLGKIAKNLGISSRNKVLIAAFTRSIRDPFVHARNASLMALAVTGDCFNDEDCALRILPAICPLLIDKEKLVRDQAAKTMDIYVAKIKKAAADMPDSMLPPQQAGANAPRMGTPAATEPSAASWTGWAISSFTNKVSQAAGEIQPNAANSSPLANEVKRPVPVSTSSAPILQRQAVKSQAIPEPTSGEAFADSWTANDGWNDNTEETWGDEDDAADAWGDMEDMDDNDNGTVPATSTNFSAPKKEPASRNIGSSGSSKPFGGDDEEPDFAGWLAAQSKAKSATKALPKGLSKPSAKSVTPNAQKKPVTKPAKKLDLKPKETEEDKWGDAW